MIRCWDKIWGKERYVQTAVSDWWVEDGNMYVTVETISTHKQVKIPVHKLHWERRNLLHRNWYKGIYKNVLKKDK